MDMFRNVCPKGTILAGNMCKGGYPNNQLHMHGTLITASTDARSKRTPGTWLITMGNLLYNRGRCELSYQNTS
jgi:hypothetical protein